MMSNVTENEKKIIKKYVDYGQVEKICHTGMLVIGTYDNFTCGNPADFLENINKHFRQKNELFFIEKTGHTYQQKKQEIS